MRVVEVFADVVCPFTHVGLRRFVEERTSRGHPDVLLSVRAWPLEIVNGEPLAPDSVGEKVDEIRRRVAPDLFKGFDAARFPVTSMPALCLAAQAYERDLPTGEAVSLELRDLLFEQGRDITDPDLLADVAGRRGLPTPDLQPDLGPVMADYEEGRRRGVVGSPYFFLGATGYFCPALDIKKSDGKLRITADPAGFDAFIDRCFA